MSDGTRVTTPAAGCSNYGHDEAVARVHNFILDTVDHYKGFTFPRSGMTDSPRRLTPLPPSDKERVDALLEPALEYMEANMEPFIRGGNVHIALRTGILDLLRDKEAGR